MTDEAGPGELLDRVQQLTGELDEYPDERARELAQDLLGAVIAMYGDGLHRIMEAIGRSRDAGATILDELAQDGAVASLLLIHDLYPASLEARVLEALETVRPYMESHGGNVELIGLEDGVAKLALQGSCNGCSASRATLELAIKPALEEHAPDLEGLEVEGITEPGSGHAPPLGSSLPANGNGNGNGFELPMVHASGTDELPMAPSRWLPLSEGSEARPGELRAVEIDGAQLLVANVEGSLLAYRNACASCGDRLDDAELDGGLLCCPRCGVGFDLPRAGRAAGGEPLQLTPVPLLASGGVRVAV
jgi:Fe-S cluster biogenesis protein NfuA/nitrite reductase/ring-hydroxylating ferredoxin subunit